jgi:RNA polymerase sigma factor (sigma-70 family)
MKLYQRGDEKAFNLLYQRHSPKLYGFLKLKLSRQPDLLDDVLQASFIKLHRSKDRYDSIYPFVPWLFTICRSVLLDTLKKKKVETVPLFEDVEDANSQSRSDHQDAIIEEINSLTHNQKEAIELRYIKEMSFDDIAVRMHSSPDNIRQLVSRGIRELRLKLSKGSKT